MIDAQVIRGIGGGAMADLSPDENAELERLRRQKAEAVLAVLDPFVRDATHGWPGVGRLAAA